MPFWGDSKKQNYKAKLEHKMCIAKESPDLSFDLTDCNLSDIPSGIFSMCRVFRKESLFLDDNHISGLSSGGSLRDLSDLMVLSLKNNKFSYLPEEIGHLSSLQILNLENNQLKKLPASFEKLIRLQQLNLKSNKFQSFPLPICSLKRLHTLDLSENPKIKTLPQELCNVIFLSELVIDADNFEYPAKDVCHSGTENIMKFLCSETGKEYISPDDLDSNDDDRNFELLSPAKRLSDTSDISASYLQYQRTKERRQQDLLLMEEALRENQSVQSIVTADLDVRRKRLLNDMAEEQERMDGELLTLQNKKDRERRVLLGFLTNVENHSAKLIDLLIGSNNKRKHVDEMSAMMERDRIEAEELFTVKQWELEELRKKEILEAMTEMLQQEETREKYITDKSGVIEQLQNEENESNRRLIDIFQVRELDQQSLIDELLKEEQFQKEAFEVLLLVKDEKHQELAREIHMIEKELSNLTAAEIKKKDLKISSELNVLDEHRIALATLLAELLQAKEEREKELKKRLNEMESQRILEMEDYWLIQYQKLLDRKPKGILDAESALDVYVRDILLEIPAVELLPLFASKGVTFSELLTFNIQDLKRIGVIDDAVCEAILMKTQEFYKRNTYQKEDPQLYDVSQPQPSAPPEDPIELLEPTAPALTPDVERKLWCQAECVVCLDRETSAVFLPCGHVCCCQNCSQSIEICPMCRSSIASKFILSA